jgi:ABC-type multidrug transport system fused ATPase/permease subunit
VLDETGAVRYGSAALTSSGGATAEAATVGYLYPETETSDLADTVASRGATTNGERRGIESVTLDVPPGKTVALVGPTGSGKTTVAHLLIRLFDPDDGVIRLDGKGLVDLERDEIADAAALVFQEAFLFDDTIAANITLDAPYSEAEVRAAAELAQAHEFIAELPDGYETLVGERGASLSGGQRQRIALARAIVGKPRLLVLDDATSAVDPSVETTILEGLASLDTTVVIVAYRRSSIVLADEVIFIEDGRITGRGTHDRLYETSESYRSLIDAYDTDGSP